MTDRAKRLSIRADILDCTNCDLRGFTQSPIPFEGPTPARIVVMGEAPTATDEAEGRPFQGAPGIRLKKLMALAGIDLNECLWMNAINCAPRNGPDERLRAPLVGELKACAGHRMAQLELAQPQWILMAGNVALNTFRPDLRIGKAHGRPFLLNRFNFRAKAFPIYHPAAILRDDRLEPMLFEDLQTFAKVLDHDGAFGTILPSTCSECGRDSNEMDIGWQCDDDCVVYCSDHLSKGMIRQPI